MPRVPDYMKRQIETKYTDNSYLVRAHEDDAGADLVSIESGTILPGETKMFDTGIAVKIPLGYAGFVFSRSGQGKKNIVLANGTGIIDSGYRGNIKVMLRNEGIEPYDVLAFNTKIAQLVIIPVLLAKFVNFETTWDDSERGNNGFGSTG